MKSHFTSLFLPVISLLLLSIVFKMIGVIGPDMFMVEAFSTNNNISHTVDLPLTTTYSCQNFCGPTSKCAISGEQCFTDVDCQGCQPKTSQPSVDTSHIVSANDSGKLTVGVTPTYSSLTSGYGTNEKYINDYMYNKPIQANFGINTWKKSFDKEEEMFHKQHKLNNVEFMPTYPSQYSLTGEFIENGPLPSNY